MTDVFRTANSILGQVFDGLALVEAIEMLRQEIHRETTVKTSVFAYPLGVTEKLQHIPGGSALSKQALQLIDTSLLSGETQLEQHSGVKVLAVPLKAGNQIVGVGYFEREGREYPKAALSFLEDICSMAATIIKYSAAIDAEKKQRRFAEALVDVAEALNSTLSVKEILDRILADLQSVIPHDGAYIALVLGDRARIYRAHGYANNTSTDVLVGQEMAFADIPHLVEMHTSKLPVLVSHTDEASGWENLPQEDWIHSFAGAPIIVNTEVQGFLCLDSSNPGFFDQRHLHNLKAFANQVATALNNANLFAQVSKLAHTDELTGLANRRGLETEINIQLARHAKSGQGLSLAMMDIDDFKEINDQHGHLIGDEVLSAVSREITKSLRDQDLVYRIGGDEVLILLPETSVAVAEKICRRIREKLTALPFATDVGTIRITASFGLVAAKLEQDDVKALLKRADQALYKAKAVGRNEIRIFEN